MRMSACCLRSALFCSWQAAQQPAADALDAAGRFVSGPAPAVAVECRRRRCCCCCCWQHVGRCSSSADCSRLSALLRPQKLKLSLSKSMNPCLYFLLKNVYRIGLMQLLEEPNLREQKPG